MSQKKELESFERAFLRAQANHLDPLVSVGKAELTDNIEKALSDVLRKYELVKVKFAHAELDRTAISEELAKKTDSILVAVTGLTAVFYKQNPNKEERIIKLPKRQKS